MKEKVNTKFNIVRAKNAAAVRWDKSIPKATYGNKDQPLIIGDIVLPCYVLSDGRRVLVQRNMASALGVNPTGGDRIERILNSKTFNKYAKEDLIDAITNPIKFKTKTGNTTSLGYDATILVDICETVLKAKNNEKFLTERQILLGENCEKLLLAIAKVGIIALVDEATGYQEDREKNALSKILEEFIAKELKPWVKTFPISYYTELCKLRNIPYTAGSTQLPQYFGHLTNNIVYKRLAPGVLAELKNITPKSEAGNKTARYFQSLSTNKGYKKLIEHLGSVVTLMKLSDDYEEFEINLNRIHPLFDDA